jgi:hypothetical protein
VVVREALDDLDLAVEVDDLREVLRLEPPGEPAGGSLSDWQAIFHARTGVEQNRQRNREVRLREEHQILLDAVLEDGEVAAIEIGHELAARVGHRHAQGHDFNARLERGDRLRRLLRGNLPLRAEGRGRQHQRRAERHSEVWRRHRTWSMCHFSFLAGRTRRGVPRAMRPDVRTATSIFSGGISD